jgi:hypothetical protein
MVKSYNLSELCVHDVEIRDASLTLVKLYGIPEYLADDFVSDAYLKANEVYFNRGRFCSVGGMVQIIRCLMLDYLKSNRTKKTYNGCELHEPYLDVLFFEEVDMEKENYLEADYRSKIELIQQLPQNHIELLYKMHYLSLDKLSKECGLGYNQLRTLKKSIMNYLRKG